MASSSSSMSLVLEQPQDDLMHDPEHGAAVIGRGGSYPHYNVLNTVDYVQPMQRTTRTGLGAGKGHHGSCTSYSGSSLSHSSSSRSSSSRSSSSSSSCSSANPIFQVSVVVPQARLRSGGNAGTAVQNYVITIVSTQNLLYAPTLVAPYGTWLGAGFVGLTTTWTRTLAVHDDDLKGVHTWGAISATNYSSQTITTITGDDTYTLGGFVSRTLTVSAWPNREAAIGTAVSDTSKLRCTNLSVGYSGSLNFSYKNSVVNENYKYTITNPSGVANAAGNLFYNCDLINSVSNVSGTAQIEIEEVV